MLPRFRLDILDLVRRSGVQRFVVVRYVIRVQFPVYIHVDRPIPGDAVYISLSSQVPVQVQVIRRRRLHLLTRFRLDRDIVYVVRPYRVDPVIVWRVRAHPGVRKTRCRQAGLDRAVLRSVLRDPAVYPIGSRELDRVPCDPYRFRTESLDFRRLAPRPCPE